MSDTYAAAYMAAIEQCRKEQDAARLELRDNPGSPGLRLWLADWVAEELLIEAEAAGQ